MLFAFLAAGSVTSLLVSLAVIALAVLAIARRVDVRLVLFLAALVLGLLAGEPMAIVRQFLATFANEKFVVPICTAMGFAYVLRHTGCDQHLVHLLLRPLTRVRFLLLPGTIVAGFLVNMPIISQTSTAVTLGTVAIPVLRAAGFSPATTGSALLLGCSIGGELFNPGAPELRTVVTDSEKAAKELGLEPLNLDSATCVDRLLPLNLIGLAVGTLVFWAFSRRAEHTGPTPESGSLDVGTENSPPEAAFRVHPLRALVPLVPLVLLYLTSGPFKILSVPFNWLEDLPAASAPPGRFDSRLIGAAMLVGAAAASLAVPKAALGSARAFCEGAGYGFTHIISLIVVATCFGEGVRLVGLAQAIGGLTREFPDLLLPLAGILPLAFAALSGSGMAATQSLFGFFAEPALRLGVDPAHVGAVVSIASAAGRTLSPVAAVTLMCATLTQTSPFTLSRRVATPLLVALLAVVVSAWLLVPVP